MTAVPEGFPRLNKETRPWSCRKGDETCTRKIPCPSCRSKRNRGKGSAGQTAARRPLEAIFDVQVAFTGRKANEETWDHLPVRVEVKAGARDGANTVWTAYKNTELQSEAVRAIGDIRPYMAAFKPDGVGDVLYVIRGSKLRDVLWALIESAA